jgi:hypothetical protein
MEEVGKEILLHSKNLFFFCGKIPINNNITERSEKAFVMIKVQETNPNPRNQ